MSNPTGGDIRADLRRLIPHFNVMDEFIDRVFGTGRYHIVDVPPIVYNALKATPLYIQLWPNDVLNEKGAELTKKIIDRYNEYSDMFEVFRYSYFIGQELSFEKVFINFV